MCVECAKCKLARIAQPRTDGKRSWVHWPRPRRTWASGLYAGHFKQTKLDTFVVRNGGGGHWSCPQSPLCEVLSFYRHSHMMIIFFISSHLHYVIRKMLVLPQGSILWVGHEKNYVTHPAITYPLSIPIVHLARADQTLARHPVYPMPLL
jgi:hypothetical protein